jgi:hypothetical protein
VGKRETQIILKTEERNLLLEVGRDGEFVAKNSGLGRKTGLPRRGQARSRGQERPLHADPLAGGASGRGAGAAVLPGRRVTALRTTLLQRRCNGVTPFHPSVSRQATVREQHE